jgi:hypothetical protein
MQLPTFSVAGQAAFWPLGGDGGDVNTAAA